MKKVLVLAYYYPPYGGGGVQRTTKYVKYLRQYGWEPVVITINEDKIPLWDESLKKDVPEGLEIIRTDIRGLTLIENLLKLRKAHAKKEVIEHQNPQPQSQKQDGAIKSGLYRFLKNTFLLFYTFLLYPDDKIGWYSFANRAARERLAVGDIDLIYTTSAPFTAHLIGLKLKRTTGKPWVMDLRDPWAGNKYLLFNRLRQPLDRLFEGRCVRQADQVITVSEPIKEDLLKAYPQEAADKFLVIPNGYDAEDLEVPPLKREEEAKNRLVFSFTGSFYNEISPRYFLEAMAELLDEKVLRREDILVELTGQFGAESLQLITAFQLAYPEAISVSGYVPHLEATQKMRAADVLLLFLNKGASKGVLTGKLFEYLGSGQPVLAMVPDGLAADLVREARAGIVADPENIEEIKDSLLKLYQKWKSGQLISTTRPEVARQYSRQALAGRLAAVYNTLI
ncbi:glycosyltransferase family 4 protein [Desulfitobacterium sp.]|uniref:glycosyltransferase family 4 protein n=1 Tax=Desulfitobacterium sp. TaxID=49981 RepID=UPI002B21E149|nr:glycosyltransferase family 4 protein [Desulfitobacterium sp.]MEA4901451.1 glycosyltransferase family 4 protein [Desulfitobacterium sp.]